MKKLKSPKKFQWKITVVPKKQTSETIVFQEQCSSGAGGNGKCGGGK